MTESALIVTQAKDGVESGGRDRVQDVTWEAGVNASEEKATATDPVVLRNVCVGLEEKDVEVPEEFGLGAGKSVPLQWRSVELEGIGETGAYRKLPPLCDKDEPEGIAESGLRYYLQNEGCTDNEVERVVESARRYYEMEALAVRAKVRERRQRREEMTDQGNRRALGTVTFQGAEESVFELYTAGEESEGKLSAVDTWIVALRRCSSTLCGRESENKNVLARIGRATTSLRPYSSSLNSASGHEIKTLGVIGLLVTLGSVEKELPFIVTDRLHVDTTLKTDSLSAFRAVIDLVTRTMRLKDTGEELQIGAARVEVAYVISFDSNVRLLPGYQALVRSRVRGDVMDGSVVLVEGVPGLEEPLRVARTLCTVQGGQVVVEVCNASTEEVDVEAKAVVAMAAIIATSAFKWMEQPQFSRSEVDEIISSATVSRPAPEDKELAKKEKALQASKEEELGADFSD
ncbi:hypothetical protein PC110_g7222 [Phytophthora cactorum]|uniref:Uncharacterized protein n=1 Tax=Phytophthora cactorum TaxID=29920 RepID=A0A329SIL9_9STRA|nr:hypothetical protein C6341_g23359 [Phytophthora cactorum]RAW36510.1 hypothetical protein PC110_g7222 [Phytophthora cactorum]